MAGTAGAEMYPSAEAKERAPLPGVAKCGEAVDGAWTASVSPRFRLSIARLSSPGRHCPGSGLFEDALASRGGKRVELQRQRLVLRAYPTEPMSILSSPH